MALDNTQLDKLRSVSCSLLNRATTEKQRTILVLLTAQDSFTITNLVKSVSREISCATSTVWDVITLFESLGIVERCISGVRLTKEGKFLLNQGRVKNV